MQPLRVEAHVDGHVTLGGAAPYVHLDALLAAAVARLEELPPAETEEELQPIEIPVRREPGGVFHLATAARVPEVAARETRNKRRPYPMRAVLDRANEDLTRINPKAGRQKALDIPFDAVVPSAPFVWHCVGDLEEVHRLLSIVTHLGKHRAAGRGKVSSWSVRPTEGDGGAWWPAIMGGVPRRHVPEGHPALDDARPVGWMIGRATYPYWLTQGRDSVTVPA